MTGARMDLRAPRSRSGPGNAEAIGNTAVFPFVLSKKSVHELQRWTEMRGNLRCSAAVIGNEIQSISQVVETQNPRQDAIHFWELRYSNIKVFHCDDS
jgi:hypothetical protein